MKLFVRGGVGLAATLFAAFLIFYAQPLSAITIPSQGTALQEQERQEKKESTGTAQEKQTEPASSSQSEATDLSTSVSGTPAVAVKDSDLKSAVSVKVANSAEARTAPLTAPQTYTAFSYNLCCRGASGLGVRRGTIAADPKILPYGTRVYLTGAGSYDGEYLVTDAGTAIKGNKIDVWVPTMKEARRFGRKTVKLTVLSYGGRKAKVKR
ncbi:MAG TPA: 3D domain-containing protein [Pyrinomonadaceae bacterium]